MQTQDVALSRQFVDESIGIRSYALHVADLAATLARNGGAPPQRPLSVNRSNAPLKSTVSKPAW